GGRCNLHDAALDRQRLRVDVNGDFALSGEVAGVASEPVADVDERGRAAVRERAPFRQSRVRLLLTQPERLRRVRWNSPAELGALQQQKAGCSATDFTRDRDCLAR